MARIPSVLVMVAFLLAVVTAGPAGAHGGPIKLEVQGDGGQGVNATVTYQNDGHMVTDEVVLNYTAMAADGQTVGPFRMIASAEGQAFYRSEKPLAVGNWTVTVTASKPSAAQKTVSVMSAALPPTSTSSAASDSSSPAVIIIPAVLVAMIAFATFVFVRTRRRSPATR
jgi:hypothetical protein